MDMNLTLQCWMLKKKKKSLSSVSLNQISYIQKPSHYDGSTSFIITDAASPHLGLVHVSCGAYRINNIFRKANFSYSALLKSSVLENGQLHDIRANFSHPPSPSQGADVSDEFPPSPPWSLLQCPPLLLRTLNVEAE